MALRSSLRRASALAWTTTEAQALVAGYTHVQRGETPACGVCVLCVSEKTRNQTKQKKGGGRHIAATTILARS